ncbi:MAG: HNH endonuclease [Cupriavidus sp.]|nr:MAG: HNH endonuclease [Cupriavidus sp.]
MNIPTEHCIWCLRPIRKGSEEHVLPDALGCPPELVLEVGVCMACNNGLGHIDQALIRQFEIPAFVAGVRRKKGKPPAINMWAPIKGRYVDGKPELHLNAGPQTIETLGRQLPAANAANGITKISFDTPEIGQEATISFTQELGREPKLGRALLKVALGTIAIQRGLDDARHPRFDPVRAFVRKGDGHFDILMTEGRQDRAQHVGLWTSDAAAPFPIVEVSLFGATLFVDTDPAQQGMAMLREAFTKDGGVPWTVLPKAA